MHMKSNIAPNTSHQEDNHDYAHAASDQSNPHMQIN